MHEHLQMNHHPSRRNSGKCRQNVQPPSCRPINDCPHPAGCMARGRASGFLRLAGCHLEPSGKRKIVPTLFVVSAAVN
jgi:hypothetical protein